MYREGEEKHSVNDETCNKYFRVIIFQEVNDEIRNKTYTPPCMEGITAHDEKEKHMVNDEICNDKIQTPLFITHVCVVNGEM